MLGKTFVHGNEYVETLGHRIKERPVVEIRPTHFRRRVNLMVRQFIGEAAWHAAIEEHSHLQLCGNSLGKEGRFRELQDGDGVLTGNARKVDQKIVQRVAFFKVIDKSLHGDAGACKDGSTA